MIDLQKFDELDEKAKDTACISLMDMVFVEDWCDTILNEAANDLANLGVKVTADNFDFDASPGSVKYLNVYVEKQYLSNDSIQLHTNMTIEDIVAHIANTDDEAVIDRVYNIINHIVIDGFIDYYDYDRKCNISAYEFGEVYDEIDDLINKGLLDDAADIRAQKIVEKLYNSLEQKTVKIFATTLRELIHTVDEMSSDEYLSDFTNDNNILFYPNGTIAQ